MQERKILNVKRYVHNRDHLEKTVTDFDITDYKSIGDIAYDYIFVCNSGCIDASKKLNKLCNTNYMPEDVIWHRELERLITTDLKYISTKSDDKGFAYWMDKI